MMILALLLCVVVSLPIATSFRYRQITKIVSFPIEVAINTLNLVKDVGYLTYDTLVAAPEILATFQRQQTSFVLPKRSSFGISATNNKNDELIGYKRGSTNVNDEFLTGLSIPAKVVNNMDNYDKNLNFKRPIAKKPVTGSATSASKYVVNPDYIYNKNNNVDTKETLYKIGDAITSVPEVIAKTKAVATNTIGSAQNILAKIQSVPNTISSKVNNVKTGLVSILDIPAKLAQIITNFNKKSNKMVDSSSRMVSKFIDQTNSAKIAVQKLNEAKKSNGSNMIPASVVKASMSTKESVKKVAKTNPPVVIDPIEKERNERLIKHTLSLFKSVFSFSGALIGFTTKLTFEVVRDVATEATLKLADTADMNAASNVAKVDDEAINFTPIELVAKPNVPDVAKEQEVAVVKSVISRIISEAENEQNALKNVVKDVVPSTPITPIELVAKPNVPDVAKEQEVAVVKSVISRIISEAESVQNVAKIQEIDFSKALNEQAEKKRRALIDDAILRDQMKKKVVKYEAIEMKKTMQEAKVKEIAEVISKVTKDEDGLLVSAPKRLNAYQEFVSRSMKKLKAENTTGNPRELMKRIAEMWKLEKEANVMK